MSMNNALAFGHRLLIIKATVGFGLYVETILPSIRPAIAMDPETQQPYTVFIRYSATAIKLPFFTIEFGKFTEIPEDEIDITNVLPGIFDDHDLDEEDEDDETRT